MINKTYKIGFFTVIALCIALLVTGGFVDYSLTHALYNPKSTFGILFEAFAYLPIYFFIPVLGACLMLRNQNKLSIFICGTGVLLFSCVAFAYLGASHMLDRAFISKINTYLCGIYGGLAAAILFLLLRKCKKTTIKKVQAMCAFAFAYLVAETGVIFLLKVIFGRDRYEDIITAPGEFSFANWFQPDFFSSGSSFPSGHTAAAMGILTLLLLPFLFRWFWGKQWLVFGLCYFYVGLMAYSRMVMGRHFLSDTAISVLIMTILFMVLSPFFEKLYRQNFRKNE